MDSKQIHSRILDLKQRYGSDLLILGHHYQSDDVIQYADLRGDSFQLAREAAASDARYIIFCGVRFMAESARVLAREDQLVLHPVPEAGCPMADMADRPSIEKAWAALAEVLGDMSSTIPVTYVNSDLGTKAFCGSHGGAVCTSSNAERVLDWAFSQGERVFFAPDQHLGRNTAFKRGLVGEQVAVYDPFLPGGGLSPAQVQAARILLWKGHCCVHTYFTVQMVQQVREEHPAALVVVHPECPREVVAECDAAGSTSFIVRYCRQAPTGSLIFVGTEEKLVARLAEELPDREIRLLGRSSVCNTMSMSTPLTLLETLANLGAHNVVEVDAAEAENARTALTRMLDICR